MKMSLLACCISTAAFCTAAYGSDDSTNNCASYDKYLTRAEASLMENPTCNTFSPEMGGIRKSLADNGFGFFGSFNPVYKYDLLGHNEKPQLYNGQRPTTRVSGGLGLTYDLTRVGFAGDAQLTMQVQGETGNFTAGNPNFVHMSIFAVHQQFFDKQFEIQYGYFPLVRQFYGNVLGGNSSTAALGPTSIIPVQLGLSYITPSPSLMVVFKDPSLSYYNRMAIARSASPYGLQYDIDKNATGFTFNVEGSKPLFIDEFGYKTDSAKGVMSTNARAGWIYNSTNYTNFRTGGEASNNYGGYLAFTQQVTQPDNESPRGLYLDAKYNYAPEDRNLYAKDYQFNLFYIGPFAQRSSDMVSLSYSRSYFSKDARHYFENISDNDVAKFSTSYSFSYAAEVVRGMYAITGLTWQEGPSFNPNKPDALIFQESLYFSF